MNIRHRNALFPILTFLGGAVVGLIAAGNDGNPPESAAAAEDLDASGSLIETAPVAPAERAAGKVTPTATLAVTLGGSSEAERDALEPEADVEERLQALNGAWKRLHAEMARLRGKVEGLERRLSTSVESTEKAGVASAQPSPPSTPEDRRSALVRAGVDQDRAVDLVWRQGEQELERLELRDVAIREGWFGSDRYRDELSRIDEDSLNLRDEIGEDSYDRYLFATGENNRVEVESIIPGSTAEEAGLKPGDLIERYGGSHVFRFGDLRNATSEGERGELVPVRIRRGDGVVDVWLPRGPLGVRLDRAKLDPDA